MRVSFYRWCGACKFCPIYLLFCCKPGRDLCRVETGVEVKKGKLCLNFDRFLLCALLMRIENIGEGPAWA